jgi:hypothetical protein
LTVVLIAIAIAILAGFLASDHPDGLEKVAGNLGFERKAASAPGAFADYTISIITHPSFSTAVAGIVGVILIYFIFKSFAHIKYVGELLKKLLNIR